MKKILVIEDDPMLASGIFAALSHCGYMVDVMQNGIDAERALGFTPYDGVILDLTLPGKDGGELLRNIRQRGLGVPVIIITARAELDDKVDSLNWGADDYLIKPFALEELEARLKAILRRKGGRVEMSVESTDGLEQVRSELSARERAILDILCNNAGQVISKEQILQQLGTHESLGANAVEVNVHRLRKKLTAPGWELRTIRGLGYTLIRTA